MLGAAPTCRRYRGIFRLASVSVGLAAALVFAANALAATPKSQRDAGPVPVWGIALDGRQVDEPNLELLSQAKAAGLNAIVTDPKRWSSARHQRLVEMAWQLGLLLIGPRRPDSGSAGQEHCAAQRRMHHPCAVVALSAPEANTLARRTKADYVVVRLDSPAGLQQLTSAGSASKQVIAVLTVGGAERLDA